VPGIRLVKVGEAVAAAGAAVRVAGGAHPVVILIVIININAINIVSWLLK
jgi:hypothetical protein